MLQGCANKEAKQQKHTSPTPNPSFQAIFVLLVPTTITVLTLVAVILRLRRLVWPIIAISVSRKILPEEGAGPSGLCPVGVPFCVRFRWRPTLQSGGPPAKNLNSGRKRIKLLILDGRGFPPPPRESGSNLTNRKNGRRQHTAGYCTAPAQD